MAYLESSTGIIVRVEYLGSEQQTNRGILSG